MSKKVPWFVRIFFPDVVASNSTGDCSLDALSGFFEVKNYLISIIGYEGGGI